MQAAYHDQRQGPFARQNLVDAVAAGARQEGHESVRERAVNRSGTQVGKRDCQTAGKQWGRQRISPMKSWRTVQDETANTYVVEIAL
jgi:hypothetical protein